MTRYILTGAPGAGKTVILRGLERAGMDVVEEAATDIIAWRQALGEAEPWTAPDFTDDILRLQRDREASAPQGVVVFDRSPVCTLALARFLGRDPSTALLAAAEAARDAYAGEVFFVESLDFIVKTEARRIDLADARRFGDLHRQIYAELGFRLIPVVADLPQERVDAVMGRLV